MTREHGSTRRTLLFTAGAAALLAGIGILPRLAARAGTTNLGTPGDGRDRGIRRRRKSLGTKTVAKVVKTEEEWRAQLSPLAFEVTRQEGTEQSFTGPWLDVHEAGIFRCVCCGTALFSSETKYDSGTGWPSFWQPIAKTERARDHGPELRDDSNRQFLRPLRGASRPRLQRRPAADRAPLLHERRRARLRAARRRLSLHPIRRRRRPMTAPRRKFSTDRVIPFALAGLLALPIVALVSQTGGRRTAAEEAVTIPPPAVDATAERRPRHRDRRRRLLLGRPGRVPARRRRRERGVGLCRRHRRQSGLPFGERRHDRPRRGGRDQVRPGQGQLRQAPPDLLLGRPQPDGAQPPGTGRRHRSTARRSTPPTRSRRRWRRPISTSSTRPGPIPRRSSPR